MTTHHSHCEPGGPRNDESPYREAWWWKPDMSLDTCRALAMRQLGFMARVTAWNRQERFRLNRAAGLALWHDLLT